MNWLRKECEPYREMISALLDGELGEADKLRLKAHLDKCEDCSMLTVAFAATEGLVKETMTAPPASLHKNVMNKVNRAAHSRRTGTLRRMLKPTLAAAACVAVVLGAVLTLAPRGGSAAARTDAAAPAVYDAADPYRAAASAAGGAAPEAQAAPPAGDVAAEEIAAALADEPAEEVSAPELMRYAAGTEAADKEAEPVPAPVPEPAVNGAAEALMEDTAPTEDAGGVPETPETPEAPADGDAPEAEQMESDQEEPPAEDTAGLMSLNMDVTYSKGEGFFQGYVTEDPSGLLAPGTVVSVLLPEGMLPPREGSGVRIRFDTLSGTPYGWQLTAVSMEFTR